MSIAPLRLPPHPGPLPVGEGGRRSGEGAMELTTLCIDAFSGAGAVPRSTRSGYENGKRYLHDSPLKKGEGAEGAGGCLDSKRVRR